MNDELLHAIQKAKEQMFKVGVVSAEVVIAAKTLAEMCDKETQESAKEGEQLMAFGLPVKIVENENMPSNAFAVVRALDE